jgi:hypothetical protein
VAFVCGAVAAGLAAAFYPWRAAEGARWHRSVAVCFLLLGGVMSWTRLPIREHHLLGLLPLAAIACVLCAARLLSVRSSATPIVVALALLYGGTALHWDLAAWRGLRRTRGTGLWSDATLAVARYLDGRGATQVTTVDWGFHTSIYVATAGRVGARELFWRDMQGARGDLATVWRRELMPGTVFLAHEPPYVTPMGAATTARFEQALARSPLAHSRLVFNDGLGRPHTELTEIAP